MRRHYSVTSGTPGSSRVFHFENRTPSPSRLRLAHRALEGRAAAPDSRPRQERSHHRNRYPVPMPRSDHRPPTPREFHNAVFRRGTPVLENMRYCQDHELLVSLDGQSVSVAAQAGLETLPRDVQATWPTGPSFVRPKAGRRVPRLRLGARCAPVLVPMHPSALPCGQRYGRARPAHLRRVA